MEETLWMMTQQSRVLQELRRDVQSIWNDQAAHELNGRYLNPHETDDQNMLAAFDRQKSILDETFLKLESARAFARQAEEHAAAATIKLDFAEQDLQSAYGHYDLYVRHDLDAKAQFPQIQALIDNANAVCKD